MKTLLGAIGKKPCESSLERILEKIGNRCILRKITKHLHYYKDGIREIKTLSGKKWKTAFLFLWRDKQVAQLAEMQKTSQPETGMEGLYNDLFTHAQCCMAAYHREAVKEIKYV